MEAQLAKLCERLEQVAQRLEKLEGGAGGSGSGSGAAAAAPAAAGDLPAWVAAYDALVDENLGKYFAMSEKLGNDEVKAQAAAVKRAAEGQKQFLRVVAQCKKPDAETLGALLKPTSEAVGEAIAIRDGARGNKQWEHLSTVSEAMPAFGWVGVEPTPAPFVNEYRGNSEFYSNKLLRIHKGKDEDQMAWIQGFNGFLKGLNQYIRDSHTTKCSWNERSGGDAKAHVGAAPAAAAPKAAPGPPPPAAGPPPAASGPPPAKKKGPDIGALMGQLNRGSDVTAGLKKVDRSQMTHKNPELRKQGAIKADAVDKNKKKPAPKYGAPKKKGEPKFELDGNKWVVEWQENTEININDTEPRHTVYAYKCTNTVIKVNGKVNAITLDQCKKVGLAFQAAIATCDLVNCQSCDAQVLGRVPSFSIDKCSGARVILSADSLDTEVITAKSDEMNVVIPNADGTDIVEHAIPEQFKTIVRDGALVTSHIEHV